MTAIGLAFFVLFSIACAVVAAYMRSDGEYWIAILAAAGAIMFTTFAVLTAAVPSNRAGTVESVVGDRVSIVTDRDTAVYRIESGAVAAGDRVILECEPQWWTAPRWCDVVGVEVVR